MKHDIRFVKIIADVDLECVSLLPPVDINIVCISGCPYFASSDVHGILIIRVIIYKQKIIARTRANKIDTVPLICFF